MANELTAEHGCNADAANQGDVHPFAKDVLVLVVGDVGEPASHRRTGQVRGRGREKRDDFKQDEMMQAQNRGGCANGASCGQDSCIPAAAEVHVEDGAKKTLQKDGDNATAVIAAICDSGRCSAANSWGSAKKTMPLLNPMVPLHIPISQTGGVVRSARK